jgi:hypothetical protein
MTALDRFLILAMLIAVIAACSAEYTRETGGIATDLHKYCLQHPQDSACQGPASK